ncbi:MAG: hypothetical protein U0175_13750 [Caldilineaceae bacterium]
MKNTLKRWADKVVQSGSTALLALTLALFVVSTTGQLIITSPKGDNPTTQVNWNASGG